MGYGMGSGLAGRPTLKEVAEGTSQIPTSATFQLRIRTILSKSRGFPLFLLNPLNPKASSHFCSFSPAPRTFHPPNGASGLQLCQLCEAWERRQALQYLLYPENIQEGRQASVPMHHLHRCQAGGVGSFFIL